MGSNVAVIQSSKVHTLLNAATTAASGAAYLKPNPLCSFQASGATTAGSGTSTIEVEVSNNASDWIVMGTITLTLGVTSTSDGFVANAPWKYVRGDVTAISGTGASVTLTMGT